MLQTPQLNSENQVKLRLTPGVNFTNILQAALTCSDPESAKKTVKLSVFIEHSVSACIKGESKTLMKLTPDFGILQSPK